MENEVTGLGWVSASELDRYGLSNTLKLAARRAVKCILNQKVTFDEIVIDGTVNFLSDTPLADKVTTLKQADLLVKEVSAASIIAKVARDNYMIKLDHKYPAYGFASHVGYGTAAHQAALLEYGICPEHRKSFRPIRALVSTSETVSSRPSPTSTTSHGQKAEQIAADHLQTLGHCIVARNFKTKSYEIDIISALDDKLYFTEVKYRKTPTHGTSLAQITSKKHQQMRYAAQKYLSTHTKYRNYQPLLAVASVEGPDFTFQEWFTLNE